MKAAKIIAIALITALSFNTVDAQMKTHHHKSHKSIKKEHKKWKKEQKKKEKEQKKHHHNKK